MGVWCLCLHRPPRGYFFSCKKNGRSHDACLLGLIAVSHLQSEKCLTISHLEYLRDDVLSWRVQLCVLPWIFSSLCCRVVFGTGRWRRAVLASERERERMASFFLFFCLFTAPVCGVICSLVELTVSENSSVDSLWLCYGRHIPRARRRGRKDHTPDSRPHHQCVVSKVVTPRGSLRMRCAVLVKRWW